MKVSFIYPDLSSDFNSYQFGIATMSSLLKKEGHEVSLMHITEPIGKKEFKTLVSAHDADLYGFSSTTNMFQYVREWAPLVKEATDSLVVCGGVHSTLSPEDVIGTDGIDIICRGEGERAMVELCERLERGKDYTDIKGLWIKTNKGCVKNPMNALVTDLDVLPFPDREIFNYENLAHSKKGIGLFMASRGCPYNCYYCCNHSLKKLYSDEASGRYLRFHSVDYSIREIKEVLVRYRHIKVIHFTDDVLPADKRWFRAFMRRYKNEVSLPFQCNVFPALCDDEVVALLKEAGCYELGMGIESGSEKIRRNILNRQISNFRIERAFDTAKKAGLRAYTYNMLGLPDEGISDMLSTVKINARIKPDAFQVSIFYPYPLTRLHEMAKEKLLLTELTATGYYEGSTLGFGQFEKSRIAFTRLYFRELIWIYRFAFSLPQFLADLFERSLDSLFASRLVPYNLFIKLEPFMHFKKYVIFWIERTMPTVFSLLYEVNRKFIKRQSLN